MAGKGNITNVLFQNAKIQDLNVIHNYIPEFTPQYELFQNAKIQDLNVIHNKFHLLKMMIRLFQNAKIQDLNVIHNFRQMLIQGSGVVSECKDTRFECNSQPVDEIYGSFAVVSECKDTRFECNSQRWPVKVI